MNDTFTNNLNETIDNIKSNKNVYATGKVTKVNDYNIEVSGLNDVTFYEAINIADKADGYVFAIYPDRCIVALVNISKEIKTGDIVYALNKEFRCEFSLDSVGKVIDIFGNDLIAGKKFDNVTMLNIENKPLPLMDRGLVKRELLTGITGIDLIYPIGKGQRQLIIGDKKTGKTQICLDTIVNQKDKNVLCIYVAIGKTKKEVKDIYYELTKRGASSYSIIIASFNDELPSDVGDKLMKQIYVGNGKRYKGFLHHITKGNPVTKNLLKVKEPKKKLKTLTKEQVVQLVQATSNIRDEFLLNLLFETGLRIGEVLSLHIVDFKRDYRIGYHIQLVDRGELENGAKLKTNERKIEISSDLMNLYDDYLYEVLDELETDTNFLFVKLKGANKGEPLEYTDVQSLFKRLKQKTGIDAHPHLLRHTHASIYYQTTKDVKLVQERLGHAQIQTTMDMYVHQTDEEIRAEWEKAQHAFQLDRNTQ